MSTSTIQTAAGEFIVSDNEAGHISISGPKVASIGYSLGSAAGATTHEVHAAALQSAFNFCYQTNINVTLLAILNNQVLIHETQLAQHATQVAQHATEVIQQQDISILRYRGETLTEGIITKHACLDTGCDINVNLVREAINQAFPGMFK